MTRKTGQWFVVCALLLLIALVDFFTPSEYVLAYLYGIPVFLAVFWLETVRADSLVLLTVVLTLLNLILPEIALATVPVVANRLLAALALGVSGWFMARHQRHSALISVQRQQLASQHQLAQLRQEFVATLTHDLKTPLLGMQQNLEFFQQGEFGALSDRQQSVLQILKRGCDRQLSLLETLLMAYRQDLTGVSLTRQWLDFDELVADSVMEWQALADARQIALSYEGETSLPPIEADAAQLKRVVVNLVQNALKYTPSGGKVQLTLRQAPGALMLEVADTGPGVTDGEEPKLFGRFYRGETSRHVPGSGLGLYLSRQIVEAHGGDIGLLPTKDSGCRFFVRLPCQKD